MLQEQIVPLKEEATPEPGCPRVPGKGGTGRTAGVLDPVAIVTSVSRCSVNLHGPRELFFLPSKG